MLKIAEQPTGYRLSLRENKQELEAETVLLVGPLTGSRLASFIIQPRVTLLENGVSRCMLGLP